MSSSELLYFSEIVGGSISPRWLVWCATSFVLYNTVYYYAQQQALAQIFWHDWLATTVLLFCRKNAQRRMLIICGVLWVSILLSQQLLLAFGKADLESEGMLLMSVFFSYVLVISAVIHSCIFVEVDGSAESDTLPINEGSRPPSYTEFGIPAEISASPSVSAPASRRQATNYLYIIRSHGNIRGSFVIDPTLKIPISPFSNALPNQISTKNVKIVNNLEGQIDAHFTVLGRPTSVRAREWDPVTIHLETRNSNISVTVAQDNDANTRSTIALTAINVQRLGIVAVSLPRPFTGFLSLHGNPKLSPQITQQATLLKENQNITLFFVGDLSNHQQDSLRWRGDSVHAEGRTICIQYSDEPEMRGFWSQLTSL